MKNQCSNPDKSPDFCLNVDLQTNQKLKHTQVDDTTQTKKTNSFNIPGWFYSRVKIKAPVKHLTFLFFFNSSQAR